MTNYYQVLGVQNFASFDEIKAAYRQKSKQWHPDLHNGSAYYTEKFKELQEAYACLSKPAKRELYDLQLRYYLDKLKNGNDAYQHYTYNTSPQRPAYKKEDDTWISGKTFFRILYLAFIVFRIATCNTFHSSDSYVPENVTFEIDSQTKQLLDSMGIKEPLKDSVLHWQLQDSSKQ